MKNIDINFYPAWTRKAITFTIDDGNLVLDRKFLDITVAFLPHANPAQGQCVWNVWKRYNTKTEYIEAYNRGQQEEHEMYGVPMNLIEPDMYDLD